MILLYDTTDQDRAEKIQANCEYTLLRKIGSQWVNLDELPRNPSEAGSWFLVHSGDWNGFKTIRLSMANVFHDLPVIRYSGGGAIGKPAEELWIRSRAITAGTPLTTGELNEMDTWVNGGCEKGKTPRLLLERKTPHYLIGLRILIRLAQHLRINTAERFSEKIGGSSDVSKKEWWIKRLAVEENWEQQLEFEWQYHVENSVELFQFIAWVKGRNPYYEVRFNDNISKLVDALEKKNE